MLSCLATFWMVGNVTVAGNAHLNEYLVNTASDCRKIYLRRNLSNNFSKFSMIFSVAAWAVIPRDIGVTEGEFLYNSWRIFTLICGIPAFLVAISLFAFPESPKFLASHGKPELALKVISKIYQSNKGLHYTSFPVSYIEFRPNFG